MQALLNAYSKVAPGYAGFFHLHTVYHMFLIQHKQCDSSARVQRAEFLRCIIEKEIQISGKYIWRYFFSSYLIKYICKHPNKGAIKYFTMHFFPNSFQKLKLPSLWRMQWKRTMIKRWVCESKGLPSASRRLLGTFLPLSNMQKLSHFRLLFHFFHILMPCKTAIILQWLHTSGCFRIVFSILNMRELVNK